MSEQTQKTFITVQVSVNALVDKVWKIWTSPEDIIHWNNASEDWHTPRAENDLRVGGKFLSRMEAKDGSWGFDFNGIYESVIINELIEYSIEGGRKVKITFNSNGDQTTITETFEAENIYPVEHQQAGWQSILDNFKKYAELTDLKKTID